MCRCYSHWHHVVVLSWRVYEQCIRVLFYFIALFITYPQTKDIKDPLPLTTSCKIKPINPRLLWCICLPSASKPHGKQRSFVHHVDKSEVLSTSFVLIKCSFLFPSRLASFRLLLTYSISYNESAITWSIRLSVRSTRLLWFRCSVLLCQSAPTPTLECLVECLKWSKMIVKGPVLRYCVCVSSDSSWFFLNQSQAS